MASLELLEGGASGNVPGLVLVVCAPGHAIGILVHAFLAHEVGLLQRRAVGEGYVRESELLELVLVAELLVVSAAPGVV